MTLITETIITPTNMTSFINNHELLMKGKLPYFTFMGKVEGRKGLHLILAHHWGRGSKVTPGLQRAWANCDLIMCCNPQALPLEAYGKHLTPGATGEMVVEFDDSSILFYEDSMDDEDDIKFLRELGVI